jgi:hypothetical protein
MSGASCAVTVNTDTGTDTAASGVAYNAAGTPATPGATRGCGHAPLTDTTQHMP